MTFEIEPRSIAIVALTFYPKWYRGEVNNIADTDKVRGDLTLESIHKARQIGYQMIIADGASSLAFKERLANSGVEVLTRVRSERAAGGRQAIEKASSIEGIRVIIKTEPEKVSLIEDCIPQISRPIIEGRADIVMPRRNLALNAATHPDYMHESEIQANKWYNSILHKAGLLPQDKNFEFFFGPIALKNDPKIVALFMEQYSFIGPRVGGWKYIQPEEWSDIQLFPTVKALYQGFVVGDVEVPFSYPLKQKENEEVNQEAFAKKRRQQRIGIVSELVQFIRVLSDDPKVRNKGKLISIYT